MLDAFPPIVRQIARIVGADSAIKLVEHYGGEPLYFPRRGRRPHALSGLIGADNAKALCERFEGEQIYIPMAQGARRAVRDRHIRLALADGKTRRELARRYHISTRQIRRIGAAGP